MYGDWDKHRFFVMKALLGLLIHHLLLLVVELENLNGFRKQYVKIGLSSCNIPN